MRRDDSRDVTRENARDVCRAGATTCLKCTDAGFCFAVIPGTGIKQCGLSPPGFYGPEGTDACMPCESSKDFGDNGRCDASKCNKPTECLYGGKCQDTPPGYYSYNKTSQCIACATATKPSMTYCPLETSISKAGGKDCSAAGSCVAGGVCGVVPPGFYSPAGIEACLVCIGSDEGATSCPDCSSAGYCFSPVPGTALTQCGLSPPGFYGPASESNCQKCSTSFVYGDNGFCDPDCKEATQCLYKGQCGQTPVGYYSYDGTSRCIPCPAASFPGSTTCPIQLAVAIPCSDAGKCLLNGACIKVPAGFYSPTGADFKCCATCVAPWCTVLHHGYCVATWCTVMQHVVLRCTAWASSPQPVDRPSLHWIPSDWVHATCDPTLNGGVQRPIALAGRPTRRMARARSHTFSTAARMHRS